MNILKKIVKSFLSTINKTHFDNLDVRWKISEGDNQFFKEIISILYKFNLKTVLDIGCGNGEFVSLCVENHIDAYGIDPVENSSEEKLYKGTIDTILRKSKLLGNYRFDCITILNFLHGKFHKEKELKLLFEFLKKHADYIIISNPVIQSINEKYINTFEKKHDFMGSHADKSTFHKLLKIKSTYLWDSLCVKYNYNQRR